MGLHRSLPAAAVVVVVAVAVDAVVAGCGTSRCRWQSGEEAETIWKRFRRPWLGVVEEEKTTMRTMKFDRPNSMSFVGEIEPRPNNLESRFCEIWDGAL